MYSNRVEVKTTLERTNERTNSVASECRLSLNLVPTFADRRVSRGQLGGSSSRNLGFLGRTLEAVSS
jgi:hypothetical protein